MITADPTKRTMIKKVVAAIAPVIRPLMLFGTITGRTIGIVRIVGERLGSTPLIAASGRGGVW